MSRTTVARKTRDMTTLTLREFALGGRLERWQTVEILIGMTNKQHANRPLSILPRGIGNTTICAIRSPKRAISSGVAVFSYRSDEPRHGGGSRGSTAGGRNGTAHRPVSRDIAHRRATTRALCQHFGDRVDQTEFGDRLIRLSETALVLCDSQIFGLPETWLEHLAPVLLRLKAAKSRSHEDPTLSSSPH
jgi:hypothetical protein